MVLRNDSPPLQIGQPVRLLVGLLAWPADPTELGRPGRRPVDARPRDLPGGTPVTFVGYRHRRPGGCVVADGAGRWWNVPVDFLAGA